MSRTATGILMVGLALVGIFVALMLAVFVFTSRDDYGRLEIPGTETFHFPHGKIHVTYEEHVGGRDISPPASLRVGIRPLDGGPSLGYVPNRGNSTSNTTNSSRVALSAFESPADGDYMVTAIAPGSGPGPNLQFGKGFWSSLFHGVPLYVLLGSAALLIGGVFISTRPVDQLVSMPGAE